MGVARVDPRALYRLAPAECRVPPRCAFRNGENEGRPATPRRCGTSRHIAVVARFEKDRGETLTAPKTAGRKILRPSTSPLRDADGQARLLRRRPDGIARARHRAQRHDLPRRHASCIWDRASCRPRSACSSFSSASPLPPPACRRPPSGAERRTRASCPNIRNGGRWFCILMSPVLFIFFGRYFGMIPGTFACVFIAALGDKQRDLEGHVRPRDRRHHLRRRAVLLLPAGADADLHLEGRPVIATSLDGSLVRLRRRARAAQSDVLLHRRAGRQHGRRAAGHGPARHHLDPAAADLRHEAGRRHPDAGRRHVRRAIWRRDLLDPAQFAMSSAARGDLSRRLPDDQAGPRRRRARPHGVRLVRRRLVGHHRDDLPVAALGESGAAIRSSRGLLADAARPAGRLDAGARLAAQGRGHDGARACSSARSAPTSKPARSASPSA